MQQLLAGIVVAFVLFVALFLLIRFFWLWYWRVNDVVGRLDAIRDELRVLNASLARPQRSQDSATVRTITPVSPLPAAAVPPSPQRAARTES